VKRSQLILLSSSALKCFRGQESSFDQVFFNQEEHTYQNGSLEVLLPFGTAGQTSSFAKATG